MVVNLPLFGIMFGFSMFIVGTISYCIGHSYGVEEEREKWRNW